MTVDVDAGRGGWPSWLAERSRVRERRGTVRRRQGLSAGVLDLASNDYLGLARHPQVVDAACAAARSHGAGAAASRVVTGTHGIHDELERGLATYGARDAAVVFSSGYAANMGLLGALGGPGVRIVLDAHAHASLIDGARLTRSEVVTAAHNDLAAIEDAVQGARRAVVAVESVYSVLGDAAPLAALAELCARHGAMLLVDEAHTFAATPAGSAVKAAGLASAEHVVSTVTLSKALGAQGGAVLFGGGCAHDWAEHVVNTARSFIFDTALAPPAAGAALAALELADEGRIAELVARSTQAHDTLAAHPATSARVERGEGAVHSVRMDSPEAAARAANALRERGIVVGCFRPPSVPDGSSRLRVTARASIAADELAAALTQIAQTVKDVHA